MSTPVLLIFAAVVWSHRTELDYESCFRNMLGIKSSKVIGELDIPLAEWAYVEKCKKHCLMVEQGVIVKNMLSSAWSKKLSGKVKDHSCPPIEQSPTKCEIGFTAFECYSTLDLNEKTNIHERRLYPKKNLKRPKVTKLIKL